MKACVKKIDEYCNNIQFYLKPSYEKEKQTQKMRKNL